MLDFISDGYTQQGYIAQVTGLHGALSFEFRPILAEERAVYYSPKTQALPADQQEKAACKLLAAKLASWTLVDAAGACVPINAENVSRVRPALQGKLWRIVAGLDPTESTEEADLKN